MWSLFWWNLGGIADTSCDITWDWKFWNVFQRQGLRTFFKSLNTWVNKRILAFCWLNIKQHNDSRIWHILINWASLLSYYSKSNISLLFYINKGSFSILFISLALLGFLNKFIGYTYPCVFQCITVSKPKQSNLLASQQHLQVLCFCVLNG